MAVIEMKTTVVILLVVILTVLNLVAFCVCWWDKSAAQKKKRRVSEKMLFTLAAIGGSLGMYSSMLTFRHKTKHWYFMLGIPSLIVLHVGILLFLARIFG